MLYREGSVTSQSYGEHNQGEERMTRHTRDTRTVIDVVESNQQYMTGLVRFGAITE